eukprot:3528924-Rhodomonas_salina.1
MALRVGAYGPGVRTSSPFAPAPSPSQYRTPCVAQYRTTRRKPYHPRQTTRARSTVPHTTLRPVSLRPYLIPDMA